MQIHWRSRLAIIALSCGVGACANIDMGSAQISADDSGAAFTSVYRGDAPIPEHLAGAEQRLLARLAANADDPDTLVRLGVLYRHVENFEAARKVFAEAADATGDSAKVLNEIAITYRASGDFNQARDTYLKILSLVPDFHDAHFNLGILYDLYLGEAELAHKHYSAYLDAAPNADARVEKWLIDLRRRFDKASDASVVNVGE
ncbi:MAG: tetratricopeptide repeat protein [Gammaproteobacteria bacterium]|nr:tetratricopeptide repeat protein [Gammaproteobacteria bacterium]